LPPGTYEAASGGRAPPPTVSTSPIARQNTGGAASPVQRQYTGGGSGMGILQPQRTGQSVTGMQSTPPKSRMASTLTSPPTSAFGQPSFGAVPTAPWDVTAEAKKTSDGFFAQLDPEGKGVIDGEVAVPFMLQSRLDEGVLASIW
jgi:epidermal growth factor receptor substrate 15